MPEFSFTAFTNADLFGDGFIAPHTSFTMPTAATVQVTVTDDDPTLSGDLFDNEQGSDSTGQTATLIRDGQDIGTGGTLYFENTWLLRDGDGNYYQLAELEQPGQQPDSFTFVGAVPPAGADLTVLRPQNKFWLEFTGLSYDDLGAGDLAEPPANIVDIAAGSDSFNILVMALTAANLVGTVQEAADITVFAPTDAAFTALATDLGFDGDMSDEEAVFGFIAEQLTVLGEGDPIPLLTDILLYHVSAGSQTAAEIDAAGTVQTLLEGATFGSDGSTLVDNEPDVANPTIVIPDIEASNGVIQVIDRVLLPIDIPGNDLPEPETPTITGIVAASGNGFDADNTDFDLLLAAVQAAGLAGALDDPEADLTVFAPNDAAFIGLSQALGFQGTDEGAAFAFLVEALTLLGGGDPIPLLTQVLTYHVVPEALDATAVLGSDTIATLQGGLIGVDGTSLVDLDPDVPNPNIISTDIDASNGIVHVIDGVLLPADLLQSDGNNAVDFVIDDGASSNIRVGRDNDFVDGNGGNDRIFLGAGDDVGLGGDGQDNIRGGSGNDTIDGGNGRDFLFGGSGNDDMSGGTGNDWIFGGRGNDVMEGGEGRDRLFGNQGEDMLSGGAGKDILLGGWANDTLDGGTGNDRLFGGQGADTFVFDAGDGYDRIVGFEDGIDVIDLSSMGFGSFADVAGLITVDNAFSSTISFTDGSIIQVIGTSVSLDQDDFIL